MIHRADQVKQLGALVEAQRCAVLATRQDDGHPYASLVALSVGPQLPIKPWLTKIEGR